MKTAPIFMVLVILLLSGCAQNSPEQARPPSTTHSTVEEISTMPDSSLSNADQTTLLAAVAAQQGIPIDQLQITDVKEADWPDACLGLAGPDEFCAQMITPGWAVSVSDTQNTWKYRTNLDMTQVKLDQP